jgi:hypothetical protein
VEIDAAKVLQMRATPLGSTARSRQRRGDDHGGALGVWGIARMRSGRSGEPDRGHHAGAGAPESAGHGEAG